MLKTQDLKDQIDQLTEQNKNLLNEIESMKKMIQDAQGKGDSQQGNGSGQGGQGSEKSWGNQGQQQLSGNGQGGMNSQGGQGNQGGQDSSGGQGQGNPSGQGGQGGPSDSSGGGEGGAGGQGNPSQIGQSGQKQWTPQTSQLADQMMKIKQMIIQLESSTAQYVSEQSTKNVTQEDMVKLVLTLMDGMIDWAFDYVKSNSQPNSSAQ